MIENDEWPFDQQPNVAALTTRQMINLNYPILQVTHYSDDHSWSFLCGTTEDSNDYKLVHMGHILELDDSLDRSRTCPRAGQPGVMIKIPSGNDTRKNKRRVEH